MTLFDIIREDRPNISDQSIKTYLSNLKKIGVTTEENISKLIKHKDVINEINELKPTMKRNILSAVLVMVNAYEDLMAEKKKDALYSIYKNHLIDVNNNYQAQLGKNVKTETQEKNWSSMTELKAIAKKMLKNGISQNALIASLYTYQPPVRLDFYSMKIVNAKDDMEGKQNYLVVHSRNKKTFIFRDYKTANKYNEVRIPVSKQLNTVLNKFLKAHPNREYLLQKRNGQPLTRNALGKMIPVIFSDTGKHITLNLIRHMVVSESIDIQKIKADKELATSMMHSPGEQENYAKTD